MASVPLLMAACGSTFVCPEPDWQTPAQGVTAFVADDAEPGGDGSEAKPFRTIAEGLDALDPGGGLLAVLPGRYPERLELGVGHDGVTVQGACQAGVVVDGEAREGPVVLLSGTDATQILLRDLTVSGGLGGIEVVRGALDLDHVAVQDSGGIGVKVGTNGILDAQDLRVLRSELAGLRVDGGGQALLVESEIASTRQDERGVAIAVSVSDTNSFARLERCAVRETEGRAVQVEQAGRIDLVDTTIEGSLSTPDVGVSVYEGGVLSAQGGSVVGAALAGIYVAKDATAELHEVQILSTWAPDPDRYGIGLQVRDDAQVEAWDCVIEDNAVAGLALWGDGPEDAAPPSVLWHGGIIARTSKDASGAAGYGVYVSDGAHLTLDGGALIEGNFTHGLVAADGAVVQIDDATIRDTQRNDVHLTAIGVEVQDGASLTAESLIVEGTHGPGIHAVVGGVVVCQGCTVLGNSFAGVAVAEGGSLDLLDSTVSGTLVDPVLGGGVEIFADGGLPDTRLAVQGCTIEAAARAAVYLSETLSADEEPGSYSLIGSTLRWTGPDAAGPRWPGGTGIFVHGGIEAWNAEDGHGLLLQGNEIGSFPGIALFLNGSSARAESNSWAADPLVVWQQLCASEPTAPVIVDDAPTQLCPHGAGDLLFEELYLHFSLPRLGVQKVP